MISFNQKETSYLQDLKKEEELCVKKYNGYASQAQDPQLKQLLTQLAEKEQQHLDSINQLINGQLPSMGGQQGGQQQSGQSQQQGQQAFPPLSSGSPNQSDAVLCEDQLSTEKYVSSTYDTAIFEFSDANVRQILNHIQKEEQEHGQQLFNYMASHGMYTVPQ